MSIFYLFSSYFLELSLLIFIFLLRSTLKEDYDDEDATFTFDDLISETCFEGCW